MTKTKIKGLSLEFLKEFKRDYRGLICSLIEERGQNFKLNGLSYNLHLFTAPPYIEHVLFKNYSNYIRSPNKVVKLLDDPAYTPSESNQRWIKCRAGMLNGLTSASSMKKLTSNLSANTSQRLDEWDVYASSQNPFQVYRALEKVTLSNLTKTMLGGVELDTARVIKTVNSVLSLFIAAELSLTKIPWILPTATKRKTYEVMGELLEFGDQIFHHCMSHPAQFSVLSEVEKTYGEAYRQGKLDPGLHNFLKSVASTFIMGGFDSISRALTMVFSYLSAYPMVAENVSNEVKMQLGDDPVTSDNIDRLSYTRCVILESLRHAGGIMPLIIRQAVNDDTIGKIRIKKKDRIMVPVFYIHRQPHNWSNPEGFNPENFMNRAEDSYRFSFLPFGAGPRACIGRNFAILQATIILASVLKRYRLHLTPNQVVSSDTPASVTMTLHRL